MLIAYCSRVRSDRQNDKTKMSKRLKISLPPLFLIRTEEDLSEKINKDKSFFDLNPYVPEFSEISLSNI